MGGKEGPTAQQLLAQYNQCRNPSRRAKRSPGERAPKAVCEEGQALCRDVVGGFVGEGEGEDLWYACEALFVMITPEGEEWSAPGLWLFTALELRARKSYQEHDEHPGYGHYTVTAYLFGEPEVQEYPLRYGRAGGSITSIEVLRQEEGVVDDLPDSVLKILCVDSGGAVPLRVESVLSDKDLGVASRHIDSVRTKAHRRCGDESRREAVGSNMFHFPMLCLRTKAYVNCMHTLCDTSTPPDKWGAALENLAFRLAETSFQWGLFNHLDTHVLEAALRHEPGVGDEPVVIPGGGGVCMMVETPPEYTYPKLIEDKRVAAKARYSASIPPVLTVEFWIERDELSVVAYRE